MLKLNLGCGHNKLEGYINIDGNKHCKPDRVCNIIRKLPFRKNSVDEVLLFHTIEHIQKIYHRQIFMELSRIMVNGGILYVSYPNFWECAKRWYENYKGHKQFWEATLYGRQLSKYDYHVCAMNPDELTELLYECGFGEVKSFSETEEDYNTVTYCIKKKEPMDSYENLLGADTRSMIVNGNNRNA